MLSPLNCAFALSKATDISFVLHEVSTIFILGGEDTASSIHKTMTSVYSICITMCISDYLWNIQIATKSKEEETVLHAMGSGNVQKLSETHWNSP